jgi:hypothetical protein
MGVEDKLYNTKIVLYNKYDEKNNIFQYFIEGRIGAVRKGIKQNISKEIFLEYFIKLKSLNFDGIYNNSYTGYDGGELEIQLEKKCGLNKYIKNISLWSPDGSNYSETKKLLEIEKNIEKIINFEEYYKKYNNLHNDFKGTKEEYKNIFNINTDYIRNK